MKTFFSVFSAILAAAIVLSGWARLNQWEQAKRLCYAQINSELAAISGSDMQARAQGAENFRDVVQLAGMLSASLTRASEVNRTLVTLLENKPFWLPLTSDERKELEAAKQQIQKPADKPK